MAEKATSTSPAGAATAAGKTTAAPNASRQILVRFMNDVIAGWRMGMTNYENSVDRVTDPDTRMKLGEFKAEVSHDFEVLRSLIRNMGGEPNPAKNLAAGFGARIQSMVTGAAGTGEGYGGALVLGQLAAGELTGNLQLRVLRDAGDRMGEPNLREFSEKALRRGQERQQWLEERSIALAEQALHVTGRTTPTPGAK